MKALRFLLASLAFFFVLGAASAEKPVHAPAFPLAQEAMLQINELNGFNAADTAAPADVVFTDNTEDSVDRTTYTFATQSIGTAAVGRCVVVSVGGGQSGNRDINSVTVGGNTATELIEVDSAGNINVVGLFAITVDTGTTADVVVTFSASMARAAIGVWAIYGVQNCTTATDTQSDTGANPSVNINVSAGGSVIGYVRTNTGTVGTWSGITEDFDASVETGASTGASDDFASAQTVAVQRSDTGTTEDVMVVGSWR